MLGIRGIHLVYGGGRVGLMGALADAVLATSGTVTGIIPERLAAREIMHPNVTDMRHVATMHERKALMAQISDAFIVLPGGFGTYDETFEALTWGQLGIHHKPVGVLNTAGFYDPLLQMLDHAVREGFLKPEHRAALLVDSDPETLLERIDTHKWPTTEKWLDQP